MQKWFFIFLASLAFMPAANAETLQTLSFSETERAQTYSKLGVTVSIETMPDGEWTSRGIAAVQFPGLRLKLLDLGVTNTSSDYIVGIGPLSTGAQTPAVIIKQHTGGAHCCYISRVVEARGGKVSVTELEGLDAAADFYEFPTDIDGDGTADFFIGDSIFQYQFTNYARSWSPPKILNVFKGNVIDVSAEPGFAPVFEQFSSRAKAVCADTSDTQRNGACAGFVASEIRLGRGESALSFVATNAYDGPEIELPSDCTTELVNFQCPTSAKVEFTSFYPAILWFLKKHGYL